MARHKLKEHPSGAGNVVYFENCVCIIFSSYSRDCMEILWTEWKTENTYTQREKEQTNTWILVPNNGTKDNQFLFSSPLNRKGNWIHILWCFLFFFCSFYFLCLSRRFYSLEHTFLHLSKAFEASFESTLRMFHAAYSIQLVWKYISFWMFLSHSYERT